MFSGWAIAESTRGVRPAHVKPGTAKLCSKSIASTHVPQPRLGHIRLFAATACLCGRQDTALCHVVIFLRSRFVISTTGCFVILGPQRTLHQGASAHIRGRALTIQSTKPCASQHPLFSSESSASDQQVAVAWPQDLEESKWRGAVLEAGSVKTGMAEAKQDVFAALLMPRFC